MKALQITGYGELKDNLALNEIEKPSISDHQVLIEIYAGSTNPIDYKIVEGIMKQVKKLKFPAPIGFDVAGVVVEKGKSVTHLEIGDEVFSRTPTDSPGSFAEFIAIDSEVVVKKPTNIDFYSAASVPLVGLTTVQSFEKARLKSGDKVLIHAGSGGVGTFAIQYAKAKGAYVYTTTSTKNVEWVKALGADRVIDYKKENYLDIAKDLDIVFDTLGGEYTIDAFKSIKKGGSVVSIAGDLDETTAKDLGLNKIIRLLLALKRWKITRQAKARSAHYYFVLMSPNASQLEDLKAMIENQSIKPIIDKVYPLSNAVEALLYQKSGRAKGKIVIGMKARV
jgi:NADPH:quinone reductase-like Zn-dependent oxidoreductase